MKLKQADDVTHAGIEELAQMYDRTDGWRDWHRTNQEPFFALYHARMWDGLWDALWTYGMGAVYCTLDTKSEIDIRETIKVVTLGLPCGVRAGAANLLYEQATNAKLEKRANAKKLGGEYSWGQWRLTFEARVWWWLYVMLNDDVSIFSKVSALVRMLRNADVVRNWPSHRYADPYKLHEYRVARFLLDQYATYRTGLIDGDTITTSDGNFTVKDVKFSHFLEARIRLYGYLDAYPYEVKAVNGVPV